MSLQLRHGHDHDPPGKPYRIVGSQHQRDHRIWYDYQLVNIRVVLTHAEYDKEMWKE